MPSPFHEPMTPRTSWIDVSTTLSPTYEIQECLQEVYALYFCKSESYIMWFWTQAQTPAMAFSNNPPQSNLMPPPSAPPSHAASHALPSPSPGPSSSSSSYTPSTGNPASPQTPLSTAENAGIVPQLQWALSLSLSLSLSLFSLSLYLFLFSLSQLYNIYPQTTTSHTHTHTHSCTLNDWLHTKVHVPSSTLPLS